MCRNFFILLAFIMGYTSFAEDSLNASWLGVAGVKITDGKTVLVFDPVFTKPHLGHYIFNMELKSDESLVDSKLKDLELEKIDALFISHTHFDHASDVGYIANKTKAKVYGGESLRILTEYYNKNKQFNFVLISSGESAQIGEFKVHFIKRDHAKILNLFSFVPGDIKSFDSKFYDYKEGEVWCYFIEHPKGNILVDQGSHFHEENKKFKGKIDLYMVGIANRKSLDDIIENNIKKIKARATVPLHFDIFFLASSWLESMNLPFINLEGIASRLNGHTNFIIPKIGKVINVTTKGKDYE